MPATIAIYVSCCRFCRRPLITLSQLNDNPLPIDVGFYLADSRSKLPELFAATTWPSLDGIRERATDVLVALQSYFLPALQLVEILDALFPNSIPLHKKWDLVVAVKHWHQRRGIER